MDLFCQENPQLWRTMSSFDMNSFLAKMWLITPHFVIRALPCECPIFVFEDRKKSSEMSECTHQHHFIFYNVVQVCSYTVVNVNFWSVGEKIQASKSL